MLEFHVLVVLVMLSLLLDLIFLNVIDHIKHHVDHVVPPLPCLCSLLQCFGHNLLKEFHLFLLQHVEVKDFKELSHTRDELEEEHGCLYVLLEDFRGMLDKGIGGVFSKGVEIEAKRTGGKSIETELPSQLLQLKFTLLRLPLHLREQSLSDVDHKLDHVLHLARGEDVGEARPHVRGAQNPQL